jgi:hypothetical protein
LAIVETCCNAANPPVRAPSVPIPTPMPMPKTGLAIS